MDAEKEKIGKEIEDLNASMKSKDYAMYSDKEKLKYVDRQIFLFNELKKHCNFFERMQVNIALGVLDVARKKLVP